ncbi:MAG: cbb3-type cytochrome c oxidase subunit I, partial [Caenispirillum sp.]|nr:cbb3-type cytochrome c oxidase subunit I [Caenispirillum sp.]
MKYQSQKVALYYIGGALTLFLVQVLVGVLAGTVYVMPNLLSELLPFNVIRMIHTNALIVWLLMGFMGATYYLLPEETERELHSPKLAILQFWLFFGAALAAVVGYVFGIHEGREFLEQPLVIKVGIVVVVLMFLYNCTLTLLAGRKTAVANVLMLGLWFVAIFFLFAFYNPGNLALDKMYWWWVVHLWVEGVWEL